MKTLATEAKILKSWNLSDTVVANVLGITVSTLHNLLKG